MDWKSTRYLKIPAITAQERKDLSKRVLSDAYLQMKRVVYLYMNETFSALLGTEGAEREIFPLLPKNGREKYLVRERKRTFARKAK